MIHNTYIYRRRNSGSTRVVEPDASFLRNNFHTASCTVHPDISSKQGKGVKLRDDPLEASIVGGGGGGERSHFILSGQSAATSYCRFASRIPRFGILCPSLVSLSSFLIASNSMASTEPNVHDGKDPLSNTVEKEKLHIRFVNSTKVVEFHS